MIELPSKKSEVTTTLRDKTFFIHGSPKSGKTTFCSTFPGALFIATEAGHNFVSVYKVDVLSWEDIRQTVSNLITTKHEFKTIIIDTADNAYKMVTRYVCKKHDIEHESELGFGRGYHAVRDEFHNVVQQLTQRGFGVVFISHSDQENVKTKTKEFTRIDSTMPSTAKKLLHGLVDFIFHITIDEKMDRWIVTKGHDGLVAGDRAGVFPPLIPLTKFSDLEAIYLRGLKNKETEQNKKAQAEEKKT